MLAIILETPSLCRSFLEQSRCQQTFLLVLSISHSSSPADLLRTFFLESCGSELALFTVVFLLVRTTALTVGRFLALHYHINCAGFMTASRVIAILTTTWASNIICFCHLFTLGATKIITKSSLKPCSFISRF